MIERKIDIFWSLGETDFSRYRTPLNEEINKGINIMVILMMRDDAETNEVMLVELELSSTSTLGDFARKIPNYAKDPAL